LEMVEDWKLRAAKAGTSILMPPSFTRALRPPSS